MAQPASEPRLQPLVCPSCAGPIPLADADSVSCPYCQTPVPVPAAYRQLKRERAALTAERAAAEKLYRRLGHAPPRVLKLFRFFESPWFWMFGAGFWIVACAVVFVIGTPWVGATFFHVNTNDLLTDAVQDAISVGGTIGSIVLGLLLASWSRKRVASRAGLQVALAAAPPESEGGPARCRRCGAALTVAPGVLGARCDYCHADNLVAIPPAWIAATHHLVRSISVEENAALKADAEARRSLRWSLFWRLLLGGMLLAFPLALMLQPDNPIYDVDPKPYADPGKLDLQPWSAKDVPTWSCDQPIYPLVLSRCGTGTCEGAWLVELAGRKPFHVLATGGPGDLGVVLEARRTEWLDVRWAEVGRAQLADGRATLTPPLSGWYRLRIRGGQAPTRIDFCATQR